MNKVIHKSLFVAVPALAGLLVVSSVFADNTDVVDVVTITVPVSCTMSGTGMNSHNKEIANGTYESEIGTTTLHAFCNDSEGFAIYAAGYTGNEIGGTNSNKLVGTSASSNATIVTGLATSTPTPDVSNWAMKLAITQDSGDTTGTNAFTIDSAPNTSGEADASFSQYHVVPNEYTKVAHKNSNTDMTTSTGGVKLTTTYAAYISKTQPADTYSGKVIYTLVHPSSEEPPLTPRTAESGKICYYPNAYDTEGTMGCQTIPESGTTDRVSPTSATLLASNFSREGYGFAGWSDVYNYINNPNAHFFGPQEDITFTVGQYTGNNNGLALYAVWIESAGSFQDTNTIATLCGTGINSLVAAATDGTTNLSSVSALTDARDNQTYAIAKLADGNCWMIENLRLENTAAHNSDGTLAQGYGTSTTYGNFEGLANAESTNFNTTNANSLYYSGTQSGTASVNINTSNYPAYRMPRYNNLNTQSRADYPTSNVFSNDDPNGSIYSYGNYYTWPATIANTTHYSSASATDTNGNTSETANTSLCPHGWRLPYGYSTGSGATSGGFSYLDTMLGGNGDLSDSTTTPTGLTMSKAWRTFPNNFLYSGFKNSDTFSARGVYGRYWSSKAGGNAYARALSIDGDTMVYPGTSNLYKSSGNSIRCIYHQ